MNAEYSNLDCEEERMIFNLLKTNGKCMSHMLQ
jgi:hypothetical protein